MFGTQYLLTRNISREQRAIIDSSFRIKQSIPNNAKAKAAIHVPVRRFLFPPSDSDGGR